MDSSTKEQNLCEEKNTILKEQLKKFCFLTSVEKNENYDIDAHVSEFRALNSTVVDVP